MKLNFKALFASLVLCSTLFSTLPVFNNSVSAMNPIQNNNIITIPLSKPDGTFIGNIIYGISPDRRVIKIIKCPKNILTKRVICRVLTNVNRSGLKPDCLHIGERVTSIASDAFADTKNKKLWYEVSVSKIRNVIVYDHTKLNEKIKSDIRYYRMCQDLENKNFHFYTFDKKTKISLPCDYEYGIPSSKPTVRINEQEYNFWTEKEEAVLRQIYNQANSLKDLYQLARNKGIRHSDDGIRFRLYKLGLHFKK